MKQKRRIFTLLILAIVILSSFSLNTKFWGNLINRQKSDTTENGLRSARYWILSSRIHIDDSNPSLNWATTAANNDWCNGSGTWGDPYIIKNVVIDGQERESCILINNSKVFFIIENCTVYNSGDQYAFTEEAGIELINTNNGTLLNNDCSYNNRYGVSLRDCYNITLSANTIKHNGLIGLYCKDYTNANKFFGNDISNNAFTGIWIDSECSYNNVSQNTVIGNLDGGISLVGGNNNNISENIVNYNERHGIFLGNSVDNIISKNDMKGCGILLDASVNILSSNNITKDNMVNGKAVYFYYNKSNLNSNNFSDPGQILLVECNNSVISNFDLSQTSIALTMDHCKNNTISNLITNNCTLSGLKLNNCYNNTIKDSSTNYNDVGIYISSSNNTKVYYNNVTNNIRGIELVKSHFNILNRNNFSNNNEIGIQLEESTNNNITKNNICQNKQDGINLKRSDFNIIRNNSINDNINTIVTNYGVGINFEYFEGSGGNNNTITENILSDNSYAGILLSGRNNTISRNNFSNCGVHFDSYSSIIEDFSSHNVDISNLVNNKPLYFYYNKNSLNSNNFSDPGQIILVNCSKSHISKVNISYSTVGISLYFCKNSNITQNNLTKNYYSGIHLIQSSYINLSNNDASNNYNKFIDLGATLGYGFGISLTYCTKINITYNNFSNNGIGLFIHDSNSSHIIGNTLDDNDLGGIVIFQSPDGSCDYNNFSKNLMKNCSFFLYPSLSGEYEPLLYIDKTNLVNEKPVYYYYHKNNLVSENFTNAGQIILSGCKDSIITNFNFFKCSVGISALYSNNITINNVNCSNNSNYGLFIALSSNCVISNSTFSDNIMGIFNAYNNNTKIANNIVKDSKQVIMEALFEGSGIASYGENNTILENTLINNPIGIFAGGFYNNISGNQLDNNTQYGIFMNYLQNSSITINTVKHTEIGISLPPYYNDNNRIYYNNFIENDLNAEDNGMNNKWDDGFVGNYWDDFEGIDVDKNGTGDTPYSIRGYVYNKDNHPLMYRTDVDTDGDGLINFEEYVLGKDGYWTNVTNPDTDYDELSDYCEWKNTTNPWNPDTDFDRMPDGWEVFNLLNPIDGDDNITDIDDDLLLNIYEYLNNTDPNNGDTDADTFSDGIEAGVIYDWWTDPTNKWWYPMPNLVAVDFQITSAEVGKPFVLNITIENNGIWDVENVTLIIWVEYLDTILYNNSEDPIEILEVDEVYQDFIQSTELAQAGRLVMELRLDPENLINETYSEKDGNLRHRSEDDNIKETILDVGEGAPSDGGIDFIWIILIIIGIVAFAGITTSYVVLRPRMKRKAAFKRQIETAKTDINNFEINFRSFIKTKLMDTYGSEWWDKAIPEYIRTQIGTKIKTLKLKKPELPIDRMNLLDFTHYNAIITYNDNWKQIFSKTFQEKGIIETNFENLRIIKRDLSEGTITREQLSSYPLLLYNITNYFRKGFNVFLSYSTLDTEFFNIKEIAKRLESYPQIDKVFYWEEDSGENIVTYMERTLAMTKVFVFFCTENSVRSRAVEDEWQAAFQMRKKGMMKIVPVYEDENIIPFLLMPLLNVKYTKDDFDIFIRKLYEEILR